MKLEIKTGDTVTDASCKKSCCKMTSYGGITRIRLKGRSLITSSQPALQAPLYLFVEMIIYQIHGECKSDSDTVQKNMPEALTIDNIKNLALSLGPVSCMIVVYKI